MFSCGTGQKQQVNTTHKPSKGEEGDGGGGRLWEGREAGKDTGEREEGRGGWGGGWAGRPTEPNSEEEDGP